jgi:histidinol-phosphate aminotransferase
MSLEEFYREAEHINPYRPQGASDALKLDANENLFLPKDFMKRMVVEAARDYDPRLYPAEEMNIFKDELADTLTIKPLQLVVASGGDQVIELLVSCMLREGQEVLAVSPTFSMYPRFTAIRRLNYKPVELGSGFTLDSAKVLGAVSPETGMMVLCNPNNPTANQFEGEQVLELVDGFGGPVLVDEAYAEYGECSLVGEAAERENLIVLRTFSKAYGLAGMRLGYAVTNTRLAQTLNERYLPPFPVSSLTLWTGVNLLRNRDKVEAAVQETKKERRRLIEALNGLPGVQAFPSATNFVLFNTDKPYLEVYDILYSHGIRVRRIGKVPGYDNCLRVTVAPRGEATKFLRVLKEATK